ncbi:FAD-dependent monooxygenase [Acinetobacter baumannii]|nr:FAD-dependent monooxygenase [Acinetobacter baumannii]EKX8718529.1 FAD-dependent monooxygenase [Acinetobacter baumannii]
MNVVIIGAGMGGLTTGIALKKFGHQVRIFEQTEKILPVGAAISLWSNGVKCLNYLGLTEKIAKLGGQMDDLAYVLGQQVQRRYAGYVNWNGLVEISEDLAPAQQWTTYVGEGKRASLMPVADGRFYFFLDVPLPAGLENNRDEYKKLLKQYFANWCQPVQQLIERLDPQKTNRVEIHDIEPFTQFYKGRVVILGDAAHSTTPDIGQGGCQAMEDAIYLARSLQINTLGLEDALRRYQNKRNERANELVLRARKRCDVTHMKDETVTQAWYAELRREQGGHIMQGIISNIVGNPLD